MKRIALFLAALIAIAAWQAEAKAQPKLGHYPAWRSGLQYVAPTSPTNLVEMDFPTGSQSYQVNGVTYGSLAAIPGWTFSRASTGYAQDSTGLLNAFASGAPRITDLGFLVENASTNLILNSNTLSSWSPRSGVTTAQGATDPAGGTTAWTVTQTTANGSNANATESGSATSGLRYTASVYIPKASSAPAVYPAVQINVTGTSGAYVLNPVTGGTTAYTGNTGSSTVAVTDAGAFWRVAVSATAAGTALSISIYPSFNNNGSGAFSTISGGATVFAFAQIEQASVATSYIPTTTATVTRAADAASLSFTGSPVTATVYYGTSSTANPAASSPINLGATSGGAWVGSFVTRLNVQ